MENSDEQAKNPEWEKLDRVYGGIHSEDIGDLSAVLKNSFCDVCKTTKIKSRFGKWHGLNICEDCWKKMKKEVP